MSSEVSLSRGQRCRGGANYGKCSPLRPPRSRMILAGCLRLNAHSPARGGQLWRPRASSWGCAPRSLLTSLETEPHFVATDLLPVSGLRSSDTFPRQAPVIALSGGFSETQAAPLDLTPGLCISPLFPGVCPAHRGGPALGVGISEESRRPACRGCSRPLD